ncbi:hypothetical protein [Cupriavidus sp. H39]|uniref:hypothetical protein n=1 Tax=Cupriavidus sp. H39 TaxID=3401635 RepID=UPI003D090C00
MADYPSLVLFGTSDSLSGRKLPVCVFGPGSRGKLPPINGSASGVSAIVSPDNPPAAPLP